MALLIGDFSGSLAQAGGAGDTDIRLVSTAGFPNANPPDTARVSIEHPTTHEIVRRVVTAVAGDTLTLSAPLGALFPVGSLVELRNDAETITEYTRQTAEATHAASVKPFARQGSDAKVPRSDLQKLSELNDKTSLEPNDRFGIEDSEDNYNPARTNFETVKREVLEDVETFAKTGSPDDRIPASKIASGARTPGYVPKLNAEGEAEWQVDAVSGGGAGLQQAEVDSRIRSADNAATAEARGNVELATDAEAASGEADRVPTAAQLKAVRDAIPAAGIAPSAVEDFAKTASDAKVPLAKQEIPSAELQGAQLDRTADDLVVIDASETGNKQKVIAVSEVQAQTVETWAQPGTSDQVPVSRLPSQALQGGGGGTGTDDQTASEVPTATTNFDGHLSSSDDTVQKALDTLDDTPIPTASEIENVVHKESAAPLEELASFTGLTGAANDAPGAEADESRIGAGTFVDNLGTFTEDGSTYTLRRVVTDPSDGLLTVALSSSGGNTNGEAAKLSDVTVEVNGSRASLAKGFVVTASNYISWNWRFRGSDDPIARDGTNVVKFLRSLGADAYVSRESVYEQLKVIHVTPANSGLSLHADDANESLIATIDIERVLTTLEAADKIVYYRESDGQPFLVSKTTAKSWLGVGHGIASGTELPDPPNPGDRFILLARESVPQDHQLRVTQSQATLRELQFGRQTGGPSQLLFYAPNYTGTGSAQIAGRAVLVTAGAPSKTPATLVFHRDRFSPAEYSIASSFVPGLQHFYLVDASLGYADAPPGQYFANVVNSDGTKLYPDRMLTVGDYSWTGTQWIFTPGVAADWATQGRPEPRTLLSLQTLVSGPVTGMVVNTPGQTTRGPQQFFDPAFDTEANPTGQVECQGTFALTGRGANTIGFAQNYNSATNPTVDFNGFTRVSRVTEYSATEDSGVRIHEQPVYKGTVQIATLRFAVSKGANGSLSWNLVSRAGNAATGAVNFTLAFDLDVTVLHNDGPGSTTFRGLLDTPNDYEGSNGKPLVGNSAEDGLVFGEFPTGGGGGGLSSVASDATLTGDGTAGNALKVANPFTAADETKLDGIEANAKDDQTAAEIRDALQGLSGANQLSGASLRANTVHSDALINQTIQSGKMGSNSVIERVINAGAVTLAKLATAVANRLIPTGGTAGQIVERTATGYQWVAKPSGGGGGGTPQSLTRTDYSSTFTPSKAATAITTGGTVSVDLAAASIESGHGLTVSANEITVARAGLYHINLSINVGYETNPVLSGAGGGRIFSTAELAHTPSGGTETILNDSLLTAYARQPDNHTGTRVGPDMYHALIAGTFKLGAGDKLAVKIKGDFIQPTDSAAPGSPVVTNVKVVATESLMRISSSEFSLS